jgi:glutamate-1-semialdehyde 2,1-aminomutase
MFGFFFTKGPVTDWNTAKVADTKRFATFFQAMLEEGVYVASSQFEAGFISLAHGADEIGATIQAVARAFAKL